MTTPDLINPHTAAPEQTPPRGLPRMSQQSQRRDPGTAIFLTIGIALGVLGPVTAMIGATSWQSRVIESYNPDLPPDVGESLAMLGGLLWAVAGLTCFLIGVFRLVYAVDTHLILRRPIIEAQVDAFDAATRYPVPMNHLDLVPEPLPRP